MEKSISQFDRMTKTSIPRLLVSLGIPAIVGMMITTVYNMVDTWFVAQLGTQAIGACGINLSIMEFMMSVGYWFGTGAGMVIGMMLGAKKPQEASRVAATAFYANLAVGVVITVLCLSVIEPLMRFLGASETILPYAVSYGRFILLGFPVMSSAIVLNTFLRCEGKMKLATLGISVGGVLNMILDPIFIFLLDLGVAGASLATLVSQLVSLMILLSVFLRGMSQISLSPKMITLKIDVFGSFLSNGLPSLTRHGVAMISNTAMNMAAGFYGGDVLIAALSIVSKIMALLMAVIKGFFQGSTTIFSYNKGAKRYDRVRGAYKWVLVITTAITVVYALVFTVGAEPVMRLFKAEDPQVIALGTQALIIQVFSLLLMPFYFSGNQILQAVGEKWKSTFLAALPQGICYVPMVFILPVFLGEWGVMLTPAVATVLTSIITLPVLRDYFRRLRQEENEMKMAE